jgi:beta-galactosidase
LNRRTFTKLTSLVGLKALTATSPKLRALVGAQSQGHPASSPPVSDLSFFDTYVLGTAYYPEWWQQSDWQTDFREMSELGFRAARMGEFAWALFEPSPGKFDFNWMDRALDIANRYGVKGILATPTAAVPPWLYQQHKDVLGGNSQGPYSYGGRKGYCTNSPAYLEASVRITTALAEHYGQHPGVIGWQLDNEPGYPFECYDPDSEKAFQEWLQKRYGTLDELNRTWNGAFWSNRYSDWSQIHFPKNSAEGGWQPAISLDYRRFFSDSFLHHLRAQADILRRNIRNQFIYTNWPSVTWSVDVYEGAAFLDATAWDNYVSAPGLSEFQHQYISGINHDIARCAGPHQRFFQAEQVAYTPPNALKQGLRLQAYINFAHGSYGQLFYEWRRPLAGGEQYRPSFVKGFDGAINPEKAVFEQLGREFAKLGPQLAGATTRSDVALIYDFQNEWLEGFWSLGIPGQRYDGQAMQYYTGFKVLQHNIDLIPVSREFASYELIVAPGLRMVDDATAERLRTFVANGGTLVLNYGAGTQNLDGSMKKVIPPGVFTDLVGASAESVLDLLEYESHHGSLDKELESQLGIRFPGDATIFPPRTVMEALTLHGAEPVATFAGGRMEGRPAIVRRRHGRGCVFYVATDSTETQFYETLARLVGAAAGLKPLVAAPYGVEVASRQKDGTIFYFLLNLTEESHPDVRLPHPMDDLISGNRDVSLISLGPLEAAVLALRSQS